MSPLPLLLLLPCLALAQSPLPGLPGLLDLLTYAGNFAGLIDSEDGSEEPSSRTSRLLGRRERVEDVLRNTIDGFDFGLDEVSDDITTQTPTKDNDEKKEAKVEENEADQAEGENSRKDGFIQEVKTPKTVVKKELKIEVAGTQDSRSENVLPHQSKHDISNKVTAAAKSATENNELSTPTMKEEEGSLWRAVLDFNDLMLEFIDADLIRVVVDVLFDGLQAKGVVSMAVYREERQGQQLRDILTYSISGLLAKQDCASRAFCEFGQSSLL